jgi:hypothetical protein
VNVEGDRHHRTIPREAVVPAGEVPVDSAVNFRYLP